MSYIEYKIWRVDHLRFPDCTNFFNKSFPSYDKIDYDRPTQEPTEKPFQLPLEFDFLELGIETQWSVMVFLKCYIFTTFQS